MQSVHRSKILYNAIDTARFLCNNIRSKFIEKSNNVKNMLRIFLTLQFTSPSGGKGDQDGLKG